MLYRILFAVHGLLIAASAAAQLPVEELIPLMHEQAAKQIEAQLAQDSAEAAQADWDELYRTSDQSGERAAGAHKKTPPPKGRRIGAICMDDTRQEEAGRGACSGRGGVRYWIYQLNDQDSTVLHATERHWNHPEPLSADERLSLAATYDQEKVGGPLGRSAGNGSSFSWSEALLGLMACVTIGYIAKLWFSQQRHD
jgi:hypothetical protein